MKIPKHISILGSRWKIKIVDYLELDGRVLDGLCDPNTKIISLVSRDKKTMFATLIHEVGHALFDELGIHLTSVNPDIEEIIVDGYAKLLVKNANWFK